MVCEVMICLVTCAPSIPILTFNYDLFPTVAHWPSFSFFLVVRYDFGLPHKSISSRTRKEKEELVFQAGLGQFWDDFLAPT